MHKIIRCVLILGLMDPALLAPVIVLGWQGRGYPWWRYLMAIVGRSFLSSGH